MCTKCVNRVISKGKKSDTPQNLGKEIKKTPRCFEKGI